MKGYPTHVLARAVIIDSSHILLACDPRPEPAHYYELNRFFYYLPGGHIEFKEPAASALLREIAEETGYKGHVDRFLGVFENAWSFAGDNICCHTHEINLIFKVCIPGLVPGVPVFQKEGHVAFRWMPLADLDATDLRPLCLKKLFPEWLCHDRQKAFASSMN